MDAAGSLPFPGSATPDHVAGPGADPGAVKKRRAPIACRRCRRMRSKCIHDKAQPPCKACREAGLGAHDCIFSARGVPDSDREYRHPRACTDLRKQARRASLAQHAPPEDEWENLPPLEELVDGVSRFTRYYFQLGFLPKEQYLERLRTDYRSVNVFLLVSILSISARLSPPLSNRFGNGIAAAKYFTQRAARTSLHQIYETPSLERCQAFYLLSIAQQGSGDSNKSYINMGISLRMAALMRLHREETYHLQDPTPDSIIRAESARRTLWMLHSQDSLHSSPLSPVSLAAADITALLPSDEDDFASGRLPSSRAALNDTPPARDKPELIHVPGRSLFASLMQVHYFWGIVGRRALGFAHAAQPWEDGAFAVMKARLGEWEAGLPREHAWSRALLRTHKTKGQDLAYLGVTMMPRLCNIVLRRPYLNDIIHLTTKDPHRQSFFANLSLELFRNVCDLFKQIDAQFTGRHPDESVGAQMAAFCVYSCGLFSAYLCKYPHLCPQDPSLARAGPHMLHSTISILAECKEVWPLAGRWADSLQKFSHDPHTAWTVSGGATMADGEDPVPHLLRSSSYSPSASRKSSVTRNSGTDGTSLGSSSFSSVQSESKLPVWNGDMKADMVGVDPAPLSYNGSYLHSPQQPLPQALPPLSIHDPYRSSQMYITHPPPQHHSNLAYTHSFTPSQPMSHKPHLSFDSDHSQPTPQHPAPPIHDPYPVSAGVPYYQQPFGPSLGPSTDGFDDELQFHIDGSNYWVPPSEWMGGF